MVLDNGWNLGTKRDQAFVWLHPVLALNFLLLLLRMLISSCLKMLWDLSVLHWVMIMMTLRWWWWKMSAMTLRWWWWKMAATTLMFPWGEWTQLPPVPDLKGMNELLFSKKQDLGMQALLIFYHSGCQKVVGVGLVWPQTDRLKHLEYYLHIFQNAPCAGSWGGKEWHSWYVMKRVGNYYPAFHLSDFTLPIQLSTRIHNQHEDNLKVAYNILYTNKRWKLSNQCDPAPPPPWPTNKLAGAVVQTKLPEVSHDQTVNNNNKLKNTASTDTTNRFTTCQSVTTNETWDAILSSWKITCPPPPH